MVAGNDEKNHTAVAHDMQIARELEELVSIMDYRLQELERGARIHSLWSAAGLTAGYPEWSHVWQICHT